MNDRWKVRPEGSTWGDWGPDDQLGRMNLVGPEQVRRGIAEVAEGRTFCLSLPLDLPGGNVLSPVRFPPALRPVIRNDAPYFNYNWRDFDPRFPDIAADDAVLLYTQYSTQWDALAHRGSNFDVMGDGVERQVYYNGFRAGEDLTMDADHVTCAHRLGIENFAAHGMQGRGVLVNLHKHFGDDRVEVGYDDLMRVMEADGVTVEEGDMLLLWTGIDRLILAGAGDPDPAIKTACAVLDGHDDKLLQWITDSGIAALISDNIAVEAAGKALPDDYCGSILPLHEHCLFKLGLPLAELWHLADLAEWLGAAGRSRFLLTAPPLRLTGAVGSPATPIATV
ncbi:cyclase family protein [Jannaschia marina]|uniref:cyclase family protein n=1 Tax=Jannaschia marina TaxID=2741674 RepID=UPI0015CBDA4D|nr:cyclase family protein [Jannaschia marina]